MKTPTTEREAWQLSLKHWERNVRAAYRRGVYDRRGCACALCMWAKLIADIDSENCCNYCILPKYGVGCDPRSYDDNPFESPWSDTSKYGITETENMYLVLLLVGLSEGWTK